MITFTIKKKEKEIFIFKQYKWKGKEKQESPYSEIKQKENNEELEISNK